MKMKGFVVLVGCVMILGCVSGGTGKPSEYWPTETFRTLSAEKLGFDAEKLKSIDPYVKSNLPYVTSVLALRHGYTAIESYFEGTASELRPIYSCTKSVISVLTGILLQGDTTAALDAPIVSDIPELQGTESHSIARDITIRHLLTMTSGLPDDGGGGTVQVDQIRNLMVSPANKSPGEAFAYCGTNPSLLSIMITRKTGQSAEEYALDNLFKYLGISNYLWLQAYEYSSGSYGLSLTSRDMAKLGLLYLRKGRWKDKQVVPAAWVEASTMEHIRTGYPLTPGRGYGFLWWVGCFAGYDSFYAFGYGGQYIAVIPALDMVVVITSSEQAEKVWSKYSRIITDLLIPALTDKHAS